MEKWWSGRITKVGMLFMLECCHNKGIAIHCPTRSQAKRLFKDMLKVKNASGTPVIHWDKGNLIDFNQTQWDTYKDKTVYILRKWNEISLGTLDKITCEHISYDRIR